MNLRITAPCGTRTGQIKCIQPYLTLLLKSSCRIQVQGRTRWRTCRYLLGVVQQLTESSQLRVKLFIVLLEDAHLRLQTTLVLTQQTRVGRHVHVAVRLRACRWIFASRFGLVTERTSQLVVLGLQRSAFTRGMQNTNTIWPGSARNAHFKMRSKNFDKRPHRRSCRYWRLNDPFRCMPLLTMEWSLLLHTHQQRLPIFFNGPVTPKIATSREWSRPHLTHGSLGPRQSTSQTASRSVQPL